MLSCTEGGTIPTPPAEAVDEGGMASAPEPAPDTTTAAAAAAAATVGSLTKPASWTKKRAGRPPTSTHSLRPNLPSFGRMKTLCDSFRLMSV